MASLKRSEKSIQTAVIDYARKRGCICKKMEMGRFGSSGWPDYLILCDGRVLFVEFKREGGKPTTLQAQVHKQIQEAGFRVRVVDGVVSGRGEISDFVEGR